MARKEPFWAQGRSPKRMAGAAQPWYLHHMCQSHQNGWQHWCELGSGSDRLIRVMTSPTVIPFGLDTFTGICPRGIIVGVKSYLYLEVKVTCDNPKASNTKSTSTEKHIASHSLKKMCRKHHQMSDRSGTNLSAQGHFTEEMVTCWRSSEETLN